MFLPILLAAFLFVLLTAVISVYGYRAYARPSRIYDRVGGLAETSSGVIVEVPATKPRDIVVRVIEQIGEQIPMSPVDQTVTKRDLSMAGFRLDGSIRIFYGFKVIFCLVMFLFALIMRNHITENPVLRIVCVVAGAGLGFYAPGFYLDKLVKKRHKLLRSGLPDALDMMVVAVEAGLGLDQAMQYVSREIAHSHEALSDEFGLVGLEMRAGKRRSEALKNLAERTGEAELRKLVAILVQTDRFGTSMGESLRTHSDFMRIKRRQDAEERAAKVGVKLVFPIFLFILPSMMIVAAGPALLKIFGELFPMMQNFGK
jgi:tight adherence protein C